MLAPELNQKLYVSYCVHRKSNKPSQTAHTVYTLLHRMSRSSGNRILNNSFSMLYLITGIFSIEWKQTDLNIKVILKKKIVSIFNELILLIHVYGHCIRVLSAVLFIKELKTQSGGGGGESSSCFFRLCGFISSENDKNQLINSQWSIRRTSQIPKFS